MSYLQAGTVLAFGIDSPDTSYGIVQSYDIEYSVQRAKATAPDGEVVSIQEFGLEDLLTMTYFELGSPDSEPAVGTPFEFDGTTWNIDRVIERNVIDGFVSVSIEAVSYHKLQGLTGSP